MTFPYAGVAPELNKLSGYSMTAIYYKLFVFIKGKLSSFSPRREKSFLSDTKKIVAWTCRRRKSCVIKSSISGRKPVADKNPRIPELRARIVKLNAY